MPARSIDTSFSAEHPYATAHAHGANYAYASSPRNPRGRGFSLSSGESSGDRTPSSHLQHYIESPIEEYDRPTVASSQQHSTSSSSSASNSAPPSAHTYTLRTTGDVPLIATHLHSWAADPSDDPAYAEGQFISGSVDLNLRTPDRIKAVILSVDGYYVIPGFESKTFMHVSETLWDSSMGDPSEEGAFAQLGSAAEHSRKLHGKYSWSFKLELPRTLEISAKEEKKLGHGSVSGTRLPPSLRQKHTEGNARIGYELVIRIKRPSLRFGNSLTIPITYMSATQPGPSSLLRQIAYKKLIPAPSFDFDPDGWRVLPEIEMRGAYRKQQVSFTCTLALALPLNYARGSFVPCCMRVTSTVPQVLELATRPTAPRILLKRGLILKSRIGGELGLEGQDKIVAQAHWMASSSTSPAAQTQRPGASARLIQGEIPIPALTSPSFSFGRIEINYEVFVMPFDIPGFAPVSNSCFLRLPVSISTFLPDGPEPQSIFTLP